MARWKVLVCAWMLCFVGMAQPAARDYAVSPPRVSYSDDGATATVVFTVRNQGGDAIEATQIDVLHNSSENITISQPLPIIFGGDEVTVEFELNLADFPAGDNFFTVEVGIDRYESRDSSTALNNSQLFRVSVSEDVAYDLMIPVIDLGIGFRADGIRLNDSQYSTAQILIGLVMVVLALFLLWFLSLLLRLLLYPAPKFGTWYPPYAVNSYHDPDSTAGRRQSWQQHAQNNLIVAPCAPNHVVVLKRLVDMEGFPLGGWVIKAIRTAQYDMYGRINRTEVIMSAKLTRRLNKVVRRARQYDQQQLHRALLPVARQLSKAALKPVSKQNRMLPMALDLRFEGQHGEVRIVFELHQCRDNAWHLIDQWEPEFGIIGARIPESYIYTLNGLLPDETYKAYRQRLAEDVARMLGSLLYHAHPSAQLKEGLTLAELLGGGESGDAEMDGKRLAATD